MGRIGHENLQDSLSNDIKSQKSDIRNIESKVNIIETELQELSLEVNKVVRVNYFDKTKTISGGYYSGVNGTWVATGVASSSDFIPMTSNDTFKFKANVVSAYHITYWDDKGVFISGEVLNLTVNQLVSKNPPAGTVFLRTAFRNTEKDIFMLVKNIDYPNRYYSYEELNHDTLLDDKIKLILSSQNKLNGLKWGIIGDSISTVGYITGGGEYPKLIADRNNITLNNLAIAGSMIAKSSVSGHLTDHMCERILLLDQDCDFIIISGGVNDLRKNIPLGVKGGTDITTFYGALDLLCRNMIDKFPTKPKAFVTPIKYRGNNEALIPYVNAIKEMASNYAIPVLDSFNSCDLQPDIDMINSTYFFNADGLHPNAKGHIIRARQIESFLHQLI